MNLKGLILIICSLLFFIGVHGQSAGVGGQTISLQLSPLIDISFLIINSERQNPDISGKNFNKEMDCALRVRANKPFTISIQKVNTLSKLQSSGEKNLSLSVAGNTTGGEVANYFLQNGTISYRNQSLITNCDNGNDQRFFVAYQLKEKNDHAEAAALTDVIYTATLP